MDLTDLYSTYERINTVSPRTLLKIVLYSYTSRIIGIAADNVDLFKSGDVA